MPILDLKNEEQCSKPPSHTRNQDLSICDVAFSLVHLSISCQQPRKQVFLFIFYFFLLIYLILNLFSFTYIISTIKIPSTPTLNQQKYTHHVRGKKEKEKKRGARIRQDQSQTIGDKYLLYQKETQKKRKEIYILENKALTFIFFSCARCPMFIIQNKT